MSSSRPKAFAQKLALEFPIVSQTMKHDLEEKLQTRKKYRKMPILLIRISLFCKYAQSQNYYYTRDINEILSETVSKATIRFKDIVVMDDDDEYFKRYYNRQEFPSKIHLLSEYYKFHTDIPRIFMEPINTVLNRYYDKRRKFEYYRIARLIEEENKMYPDRPPKGIVGEKPSPVNSLEADEEDVQRPAVVVQTMILKDISELNRTQHEQYQEYANNKPLLKNQQSQNRNKDQSATIQEIWRNLEKQQFDVRINQEDTTMFQSTIQNQESVKLTHFIKHIRERQEESTQLRQLPQPSSMPVKTINSQFQSQIIQRAGKQRVISEQADIATKTPQYSIERLPTSRQGSQQKIENPTAQTQVQPTLVRKNSGKQITQPSTKSSAPSFNLNVNVAAKQFQINLLNLKDLKLSTQQSPAVQSARASSAIDQDFKEAVILSNLRRLNFLKNQVPQPTTSANTSPTNVKGQIQKKDLFQGNLKNISIKKNSNQQPSQVTQSTAQTQSKNFTSDQEQSKQVPKVSKLQTIYIEEELEESARLAPYPKQGPMTHRPKVASQNFFNTTRTSQPIDQATFKQSIQKEALHNVNNLIEKQKRQQPIDLKKLQLGNLEMLQTTQQAPLSNRSHQPTKSTQFIQPSNYNQQPVNSPRNNVQKQSGVHSHQNSIITEKPPTNINQKQYLQELIKQADSLKKKLSLDQQQLLYSKNLFLHPTKDFVFQSEQSGCLTDRVETSQGSYPHHKKIDPKMRMIHPSHNQPSPSNSQIHASQQQRIERPASRTNYESQPQRRILNKRPQ